MATIDLVNEQYEALVVEHTAFVEKGNGAAGTRARKAAMELSKRMQDLRVEIQEVKNVKKTVVQSKL